VDVEITNNQKGETIIRKRQIRRNGPSTAALGPKVVQIRNLKPGKGFTKQVNPEQIKSSNIRPVKEPRKNCSIGQKSTRNVKSNLRPRAGGVGRAKGLKTSKSRKARAPKRRILKANNIRGVQSQSKGMKQGKKHIPAPEAVVLNNGEKRWSRKVRPWGR